MGSTARTASTRRFATRSTRAARTSLTTPVSLRGVMRSELLEQYANDGSRRGSAPDGAYSGAAGGAPCGDLVRISLHVERGRVAAARFDAEGCAAAVAAGAA